MLDFVVTSLDGAFTEKEENDRSGMTVWGCYMVEGKRRIILLNAWQDLKFSAARVEQGPRESPDAYRRRTMANSVLMEWIEDTCKRFKVDRLLIEAAGPGISAAQAVQSHYGDQPWGIQLMPVKGDKVARALAVQPTFAQLMVYAPARDWGRATPHSRGSCTVLGAPGGESPLGGLRRSGTAKGLKKSARRTLRTTAGPRAMLTPLAPSRAR